MREADACERPGEIGALLRRGGLYSSHLGKWRAQRDAGALGALEAKPRGPRPPSGAPRFHSVCNSGGGALSQDGKDKESAPYLISISPATDLSISRRVGRFEGHPGTEPRYVPCVVAGSVAYNGMDAWDRHWPGNSGWMGAGWIGAANGPWFGDELAQHAHVIA